jgi:hypothetical protein
VKRLGFFAGLAIGIHIGWTSLFVASFMRGKGAGKAVDRG